MKTFMQNNAIPCLKFPVFLLEFNNLPLTITDKILYILYFNALDVSFRNEQKDGMGYYATINRKKICDILKVKNNAIRVSIRKMENEKFIKDIVTNYKYIPNKTYLYAPERATKREPILY